MTNEPNILDQILHSLPAPDELDELMARDPTDLQSADIDKIIAYQRRQRANREAGKARPKRGVNPDAPKVSLDLSALGLTPKPAAATPTKPGAGLRRL